MTSHETAIAERLRAAADRIEVDADASRRDGRRADDRRRAGRPAAARAPAPRAGRPGDRGERRGGWSPPFGSCRTTGPCGRVRRTPPRRAGRRRHRTRVRGPRRVAPRLVRRARGGYRDGGYRTGRWVSMAIGREVRRHDRPAHPDLGLRRALPAAGRGGDRDDRRRRPRRSVRFEGWQALATDGTPTVVVSGSADERTLAAVLDAVEVTDPSGDFSLRLRSRPEGYSDVVSPGCWARIRRCGPSLGGRSPNYGINVVSEWTDPLLGAVGSGADLTAVDVDGGTGWTGLRRATPTDRCGSSCGRPAPGSSSRSRPTP